jgi:germination protein M
LETYVIKELIDGPKEQGYNRTLSEDTTLVSAVTTDGTCYVTFGENFEQLNAGINTQLTIYSIVNSLSELSYITKVRISINGNTADTYNGVSLDQAFSRNLDILVEE